MVMHWYDRTYYEDPIDLEVPEFVSGSDSKTLMSNRHSLQSLTPFDFQAIQHSVWVAAIPATVFIFLNLSILKMDNLAEYVFFRDNQGKIKALTYFSFSQLALYSLFFVGKVFVSSDYLILRNCEGLIVYLSLASLMFTLCKYTELKKKDLDGAIQKIK